MARGTATVGYGSKVSIDDQGTGAVGNGTLVEMVNVISVKEPASELGMQDSKTLDIASRTINRIPGVFNPGEGTITWEFVNNGNGVVSDGGQWTRMNALRESVLGHSFRFSTILANGSFSNVTATLFVTKNEKQDVTADGTTTVVTSLSASGPPTMAG